MNKFMKAFLMKRDTLALMSKCGRKNKPSEERMVGCFEDASYRPGIPFELDEKASFFEDEDWKVFEYSRNCGREFWNAMALDE